MFNIKLGGNLAVYTKNLKNNVEHAIVSVVTLLPAFYNDTLDRIILSTTVKPVLRDNCHERPPVLKDDILLAEGPIFQCNWTCLSPKTT